MAHILQIDASPRAERSLSRSLAQDFITAWKTAHPSDTVTYRDLGRYPVPHVDESWIAAAFTPPEEHPAELAGALEISDQLIDELFAANRYVFGIPMYNLNVPSAFKAYIDQIVRVHRTFAFDTHGIKGLIEGKKLLVITTRSSDFRPGTPLAAYDFQEPYLRAIFGFIGITDITFVNVQGTNTEGGRAQALAEARAALHQAVANW